MIDTTVQLHGTSLSRSPSVHKAHNREFRDEFLIFSCERAFTFRDGLKRV